MPADVENITFASRQLTHLLQRTDRDTALDDIRRTCGPDYATDVERLRKLLTATPPGTGEQQATPYAAFAELASVVDERERSHLFARFVRYAGELRGALHAYWTGFMNMVVYLAALCAVAGIIAAIYALYVLPSFSQLFSTMGSSLPDFTNLVFSPVGLPLPLVAAAGVAVYATSFVLVLRRRTKQLRPLPAWLGNLPMIGLAARTYNYGLFINFARLLMSGNVPVERAVDTAAERANQPSDARYDSLTTATHHSRDRPLTELGMAARLHTLEPELDFQCDRHPEYLVDRLLRFREQFGLALKVLVYALIGSLVVATYLPIFQMGSVV